VALTSFAGIFSRWFVVGFFLPIFFGCVGLDQMSHGALIPKEDRGGETRMLVYGGVAVLLGLLLTATYARVIMLFCGHWIPGPLAARRRQKWINKRNALAERIRDLDRRLPSTEGNARGRLEVKLHRYRETYDQLPPEDHWIEPTKFGNALGLGGSRLHKQFGLNLLFVWPALEAIVPEDQRQLELQARTDTAFAVNGALAAGGVAALALGNMVFAGHWSYRPLGVAGGMVIAGLLYLEACDKALRWVAETQYALVSVHWLELCDRLGTARPGNESTEERRRAAKALGVLLHADEGNDQAATRSVPQPAERRLDLLKSDARR